MLDDDTSMILGFSVFAVIVVGALVYFFAPYNEQAVVLGHAWERRQYEENRREDWSVPATAKTVSSTPRYHHSESYACGTETTKRRNADGTTTTSTSTKYCSRSVYWPWYTFDIWEWTENRYVRAVDGTVPYTPDPELSNDPVNPERRGKLYEQYTVGFQLKNRTLTYNTTQEEWDYLKVEQTYTLVLNNAGAVSVKRD